MFTWRSGLMHSLRFCGTSVGPSIVTFPNGEQGACKAKRISNRARKKAGTDRTRTGRRNNKTKSATCNVTVNKPHTQGGRGPRLSFCKPLTGWLGWLVNGNRSLLVTVTATTRNCYSSCMEMGGPMHAMVRREGKRSERFPSSEFRGVTVGN